jgi:hypothetical protein
LPAYENSTVPFYPRPFRRRPSASLVSRIVSEFETINASGRNEDRAWSGPRGRAGQVWPPMVSVVVPVLPLRT